MLGPRRSPHPEDRKIRPPLPKAPTRKPTGVRTVTFQGDTLHRRTQSFAPLATLFGRALGEEPPEATDRAPKSGGNTARRKLDFQKTSTPTGLELKKFLGNLPPTVTNTQGWLGGDSEEDITDDDILTVPDGEDFESIGTPSRESFIDGLNPSERNSEEGSSTHTRARTSFGGPSPMTH